MEASHVLYMQRAIELAKKGTRLSFPNPSVGAVLVCEGKIIGEGYTSAYGGAHAEVNAINAVVDKSMLAKASFYVTLEPCSHYGKTPPCANLIVKHKIPNVYIGCIDTFSEVSGRGVKILLDAGCNVEVGVLEQDCLELHKRFLGFHNDKKPYVVLKWAQTKDAFIDVDREVLKVEDAKPTWISNSLSRQKVHQLRAQEHAIMVGTNTALKDNPSLTARSFGGMSPVRILLDRNLRVPVHYSLYNGEVETMVFTEKIGESKCVTYCQIDFDKDVLTQVLDVLYQKKIQSLIVEGGKQLLQSFIDQNLWNEAMIFVGDQSFKKGVKAPVIEDVFFDKQECLAEDVLKYYRR